MIRLKEISLKLATFSLENISLQVDEGEFFALIGPTGSGKTLILESIAGLMKPTNGRIFIAGRDVTGLDPEHRGVGIVYQDHALFPHLSVRKNITYGLRYLDQGGRAEENKALALGERLGISHLLDRGVANLSGGEKQRVSLARALSVKPRVLLLDEPLSALDPNFRGEIRDMLADLHRETGLTCLMVSHDFSEVRSLAGRVAVIRNGRLEQTGAVEDIFLRPETRFVARFVGVKNLFPATCQDGRIRLGQVELCLKRHNGGGPGYVCIRPETVRPVAGGRGAEEAPNSFGASVRSLLDMGAYWEAQLQAGDLRLYCHLPKGAEGEEGVKSGRGRYRIDPDDIHFLNDAGQKLPDK